MFRFLRELWAKQWQKTSDPRAELLAQFADHVALIDSRQIPHSYEGRPDLSYYTESAQFYYDLICESVPHLKDKPRAATDRDREMASLAYNRIVHATWGLIARGADAGCRGGAREQPHGPLGRLQARAVGLVRLRGRDPNRITY